MSAPMSFRVSPIVEAFLQTATSRRSAVDTIQKLYETDDGQPPSREVAVAMVEAYYEQRGGKPWLRKTETVPLPAPVVPSDGSGQR